MTLANLGLILKFWFCFSSFDLKTPATTVNNLRKSLISVWSRKRKLFLLVWHCGNFQCNSLWFPIHMLYCLTTINNKCNATIALLRMKKFCKEHPFLFFLRHSKSDKIRIWQGFWILPLLLYYFEGRHFMEGELRLKKSGQKLFFRLRTAADSQITL